MKVPCVACFVAYLAVIAALMIFAIWCWQNGHQTAGAWAAAGAILEALFGGCSRFCGVQETGE